MRALWEAIARRGEKRTVNGSVFKAGLERAKFMEFANGSHSELSLGGWMRVIDPFSDDTCTQAGYWTRVSEFVASLDKLQNEKDVEEQPAAFKKNQRSSSTSSSDSS